MALKYTIDALDEVPGPLRSEYTKAADGKFHLALDGHPDTARVKEFRDNNIALKTEKDALAAKVAAFDGIDADAAKAALAKMAAGEDADTAKLKLQLAEAQSATATATQERDALVFRQLVQSAFIAAGGRAAAVDFMVDKVPFVLVGNELKPKEGVASPNIQEWMLDQAAGEHSWVFHPNTGGSAIGAKPGTALGARSNVRILRNPSAQELGAAAADIAAGKVKVEITT